MIKLLHKLLTLLPIIIVTLLVFRKTVFSGLLPIPGDLLLGAYYPWLDSKWGYSVGVPVKNPMPSDVISIMYPWRYQGISILKSGELPLWDKTTLLGTPLLANFQAALLNPLNILFFFLSFPVAWSIQVVLQPLLISFFTYLFLKEIGLSKIPAILGSLVFSFSGFSLVWMEYNTIGYTLAFLPLIFLFSYKIAKKGRIKDSFLLAIVICLQIFSGYPQISIYTLIFSSLYFSYYLFLDKQNIFHKIICYSLGIISGLLLSGIQLLPSLELMNLSIRATDTVAQAGGIQFFPLNQLLTFFVPNFFGNPATGNYWGSGSYDNFAFYIPSVGIPFLLYSVLTKNKSKKNILIFLFLAGLSLFMAFDNPISRIIINCRFLGLKSSVATRILSLFDFSCAALSAYGMEAILSREKQRKFRLLFPSIISLGLLSGLLIVLLIYRPVMTDPNLYAIMTKVTNLPKILIVAVRNSLVPIFLIAITSCTITILKSHPRFFLPIIFFLLAFEITITTDKYLTFFAKELIYPQVDILNDLKTQLGFDRFDREQAELIPSNTWVPYGLVSASGQNPFYPKSTSKLFSISYGSYPNLTGRFVDTNLDSPLLDTFDIKYILVLNRHPEKASPDPNGEPFKKYMIPKFSEYKNYKSVRILENNTNLGFAWFSKNVTCQPNEEEVAKIISDKEYSPSNLIVINCQGNNIINAVPGSASVLRESSNFTELEVETKDPNYLVISKAYYPGWKVYLNEVKQPLSVANIALMSVLIPPGKHKLSLKYEPFSFYLGALLSSITLGLWGVFLISGIPPKKVLKLKRWTLRQKHFSPGF